MSRPADAPALVVAELRDRRIARFAFLSALS